MEVYYWATKDAELTLDYNQPNSYLNQINLNSGSGFVNVQSNIIGICPFIVIHIWLLIWSYAIPKDKTDWYLQLIDVTGDLNVQFV